MAELWFDLNQKDQAEERKLDCSAMLEDGLLSLHQPSFAELIEACLVIQDRVHQKRGETS